MGRRLNKDRVFRHMAKDAPDYKIFYVDRDSLRSSPNLELFKEVRLHWQRLMRIKHKGDLTHFEIWDDYDIDFNRRRLGMAVKLWSLSYENISAPQSTS